MIDGTTSVFTTDDIDDAINEIESDIQEEYKEYYADAIDEAFEDDSKISVMTFEAFEAGHESYALLLNLKDLRDECGDAEFINDSYFEEYAENQARDCYDIPEHWPYNCIDWADAAKELQVDYQSVDFEGGTFWWRDR